MHKVSQQPLVCIFDSMVSLASVACSGVPNVYYAVVTTRTENELIVVVERYVLYRVSVALEF